MNEEYSYAPVAVFCYNRCKELERMIKSLKSNVYAIDSELYIFCDGSKTAEDKKYVEQVRGYVREIRGFKSIHIEENRTNRGLAASIILGVSKILERYDRVIVIEDDLILSTNFLSWMNQALNFYASNEQIFSISGFSPSVIRKGDKYLYDAFFTKKAHSWGWATWKDRWKRVDWNVMDWDEFSKKRDLQKDFNSIGSEMSGLLFDQMRGVKDSWWVRFCYTEFKLRKQTVYPIRSKVINDGFTTKATHCNVYNRYRVDFDQSGTVDFVLPKEVYTDQKLVDRFFYYYSVKARVIGKLKTILMKIGLIKQYVVD